MLQLANGLRLDQPHRDASVLVQFGQIVQVLGHRTELVFTKLDVGVGLRDDEFSERYLDKEP